MEKFDFQSWWMLFPLAYLVGSLPNAVWIGRIFHGIDVREHGSGNAGATNVMRVLGAATGIPVLLLDFLKGWAAVQLVQLQTGYSPNTAEFTLISIGLGLFAVVGHIFPLFAGFRGGKGVATIAGVCLALHPWAFLSALAVFVLVLLLSRYVSLSSILAGLSFPIWVILVFSRDSSVVLSAFSLLAAVLLVFTHRNNIRRLLNGNENKAGFLVRSKE